MRSDHDRLLDLLDCAERIARHEQRGKPEDLLAPSFASATVDLAGSLAYGNAMSIVPVGDARDHFSKLIGEVERTHERVTVTRHGRAVAVLLSPDDLESLEETLDILSQPGALAEIQESVEDIAAGRLVSIEEIRAEFGRPGE
jgi:antitoxin YefM